MSHGFITLTSADGTAVFLNTSMIWRFYKSRAEQFTTLIYTNGAEREVRQLPEEILEKIEAAHQLIEIQPQEAWRSMLPGGG